VSAAEAKASRRAGYRRGHAGERLAALRLLLAGYPILVRRPNIRRNPALAERAMRFDVMVIMPWAWSGHIVDDWRDY
jgi:Holliday junction resolvase-like predicted endonuclease